MRKIDVAIKKIQESGEKFQGENYMYNQKCPKDYGMEDAKECDKGNYRYSCKECWESKVKKYYICSNYDTSGLTRTFWKPDFRGYTIDLKIAGIYDLEEIKKSYAHFPVITKENLDENRKHDNFIIEVGDVELLGKKMECVLYRN